MPDPARALGYARGGVRLERLCVHDYRNFENAEIDLPGPLPTLAHPLEHHTFRSFAQYWRKLDRYSDWGARQMHLEGRRTGTAGILFRPLGRFVRMYLLKLGFLDGDGQLSGDGTLEFSLVDHTVTPQPGDAVLTWGSRGGAPYLPGLPIGSVVSVRSSPSELTQTATIRPYVDFSSLDVVGIVTDGGSVGTDDTLAGSGDE